MSHPLRAIVATLVLSSAFMAAMPTHLLAEYTLPESSRTPFADVTLHHPYFIPITCLRQVGVLHGDVAMTDELRAPDQIMFYPGLRITRDEALKIILRTAATSVDSQEKIQSDPTFGTNMSGLIQYAQQIGIINPVVEEKAFRPKDEITRYEFLKMTLRANGVREKTMDQITADDRLLLPIDVSSTSTFLPVILASTTLNLLEPKLATWNTNGWIMSLAELDDNRLANLKASETIPGFRGDDPITREEASDLLYRVLSTKNRSFGTAYEPTSTDNLCPALRTMVKQAPLTFSN